MPDTPAPTAHTQPDTRPDTNTASGLTSRLQSDPQTGPLLRQVKASAGSGKTFDLTRRFLQHLARTPRQGHKPGCALRGGQTQGWGDILAVTFTNSAAAEMKERVVRRLKECALRCATEEGISPEQAEQWVDIILRQYGALNIRTIDSLLHLVVRTAALDLGLPPDFQPSFATEETLTPILDSCLERAWQGDARMLGLLRDACRSLLLHSEIKGFMAGDRLVTTLPPLLDMVMLGTLPQLSPPEALEERLSDAVGDCCRLAAQLLTHMDEEGLKLKSGVREVVARAARGDLHALGSAWLGKDNLDACMLKAGQGTASALAERVYAQLVDVASWLGGTGRLLRKGLELYPFVELAREVAAGLEEFQQEEGRVPGVLMPALARQVLELSHGVPAALCRLGSSLNHILVDEFQDTSMEQWQALRPLVEESLSRGGSLTWVGDIKQAIYGWRGGDASLFDGVLQDAGLRAIAPRPDRQWLDTNWRSREEIVRCNNTLFSCLAEVPLARDVLQAMLPKDTPDAVLDDAATTLAQTFAQAAQKTRPVHEDGTGGAAGGLVTLTPVSAPLSEELNEAVREALRQRLLDDLALRRPWGDITILVRSNSAAARVAAWLMEWGVPVITENSLLLGEHPLVAESVAFLSFLDAPQDDLSFWTVLTGTLMAPCLAPDSEDAAGGTLPARPSPACLRRWALTRRKGYLCMAFKEDFPLFWAQWFAPFHGKAGLLSPYDTVQEWYGLLRVPQRFPQAQTFVRRFLEVLHTAGERGLSTASAFLEHWKRSGGEEKVPMPTGMDAVSIMTIHKSKGLQFPVVIIPWMGFSGRQRGDAVAVEVDGLRVLAPRCKEMGDMHYAALAQSAQESLNLLYVAWTRAEQELHAFHTTTPGVLRLRTLANALETLLPAAGFSLPGQWGEAESGTPAVAPPAPAASDDAAMTAGAAEESWNAPPPDWRPMHWLPRLKVFRNPLQELGMTAKRRGILTHHCLEQLQITGNAVENAQRAVDLGMRTFALPVEDADGSLRRDLTTALTWYASLPETALWTLHGLPEQTLVDETGQFHRVDLLVPPQDDGEGWLAIDYKTGREGTAPHADGSEAHVSQIRRYLHLLDMLDADGTPSRPPARGVLVYLDLQRCRVVSRQGVSPLLDSPAFPAADIEGGRA